MKPDRSEGNRSAHIRLELIAQAVLESVPDAIVVVDREGRILFVNHQTEKIFGYHREELLGNPVEVLVPERFRGKHIRHREGYFDDPQMRPMGMDLNLTGLRKDGSKFPIEISLGPISTEDGTVVTAVIRDITYPKWVMEALRQSEAKNRALLDTIPDMLFRIGRDGTYLDFKTAKGTDPLLPPNEFLGKKMHEVLPVDVAQRAMQHLERALQIGTTQVFEYKLSINGEPRDYEARIAVSGTNEVLAIVRDITERKHVEEEILRLNRELEQRVKKRTAELQSEKDLLQKYLEVVGVIMVVLDVHQNVVLINKKGCEVLGLAEQEILGRNWFDTFIPEYIRDETKAAFSKLIAGEIVPVEYFQNPVLTKSGEERMISWHNAVLRDEAGKIYATLSSGEDITEKLALELQVRQSEKLAAIGQLTSGLAHEIGTPLNVIAGRAEYMLRKMPAEDSLRENLERIIHQIERITKIVSQLLSFTRTKPLEIKPLRLRPMLHGLLSFFEHQMEQHGITSSLECPETLPEIMADPDQIQQVCFNVILNAIQAMPEGGRLAILVSRTVSRTDREDPVKDQYVRIHIQDSGVGISEEYLSKIFDPFFTTKEAGQGTGLGLAVSYGIVRNHGGWMDVKSRIGEGTAFNIYLPLKTPIQTQRIGPREAAHG